jgi:RimJ/RimL family protein N-acetyltransferase
MKIRKDTYLAGFKPLHGTRLKGQKIELREKKFGDVRNDYAWQCDPELCKFDAVPVLEMPFTVFLLDYAAEIKRTRRTRFPLAIDTPEGKHIGNCTCYDIDENTNEAQFGIMIGDRDYRDKGYGADVVNTMVDFVYRTTNIKRLYLKTLNWNLRAQKCFLKSGFSPCGELRRDGYHFILMEMNRDNWEKGRSNDESPANKL